MNSSVKNQLRTIGSLLTNIILSLSIVLLNKVLFARHHVPTISLTCVHFIFTSIGMQCCRMIGVFVYKPLPLKDMLPVSFTFCGFVVLTNLSLQYNSVGTYQIIKTLTTPFIIALQTFAYHRKFSLKVKLTLIPITIGVFLESYFDMEFYMKGIIYALLGVVVTSLYQVWIGEKQQSLGANALQLLYYQAPLSAACLLLVIPFYEPVIGRGSLLSGSWNSAVWEMILCTGFIAFFINISIFWIIGNTSPLTYNMVGHLKFCFILVIGFYWFQDQLLLIQFIGIILTFSGVLLYTHFKLEEQRESKAKSIADSQPNTTAETTKATTT